jgi:UDP-2,3-diacylglucosamine pyrophosphatase LpxH
MTTHYRSIFISDIHLGTKSCQAEKLLEFLRDTESEHLYLVGDIVDCWYMTKNLYWPQSHNDVIQKILRKGRKGTEIVYIPGNHDEIMRNFTDQFFGNIILVDQYTYIDSKGNPILVIHGDQFDVVIRKAKWLAHLGSWAYDLAISANGIVNWFRRLLRRPYWSLSAWAKQRVKSAVNFIGEYETTLANYARTQAVDGIICGHIHSANISNFDGIAYMNCGDWVESCTALVETHDGEWRIIRWAETENNVAADTIGDKDQ